MSTPGEGRVRRIVLAASALAALHCLRFTDPRWALDDAWISFRYARNLVEHGVLSYDLLAAPVEGMSNLLWTLLSACWIAVAPDRDPIVFARGLGVACHVGTAALVCQLAARCAGRAGGSTTQAAAVAGGLFVASGTLAFYAMSGLETALWVLLFIAALERCDRTLEAPSKSGPALATGLILGLLAATRPEGALLGLLTCGLLACCAELRWRAWLRVALPFGGLLVGLEVFRWSFFGDLVPNTFYAKPGFVDEGIEYVAQFIVFGTGFLGLLAAVPAVKRLGTGRALAMLLGAAAVTTAWTGGDWMPGSRRLAEVVAGSALLCGVGFSIAEGSARRLAWLGVAAWVAAAAGAALVGWDRDQQVPWEVRELAEAANQTPDVDDVALVDIGRFGWFFEGRVFDLVGLTDRHIAHQAGGHGDKAWDETYFRTRLPDLVLVRSEDPVTDPLQSRPEVGTTEGGVLKSMLTAGGYRYHASIELGREEFHWLLVFRRADVALPPELWGPTPARDLRELLDGLLLRQQLPTPSG